MTDKSKHGKITRQDILKGSDGNYLRIPQDISFDDANEKIRQGFDGVVDAILIFPTPPHVDKGKSE